MANIEFGDFTNDDAVDAAPPDGTATARIYQNHRARIYDEPKFDELSEEDQMVLSYVFVNVVNVHYGLTPLAGAILIATLLRYYSQNRLYPRWSQIKRSVQRQEILAAKYILVRLEHETGVGWDRD